MGLFGIDGPLVFAVLAEIASARFVVFIINS
jgi:hypothetical protein